MTSVFLRLNVTNIIFGYLHCTILKIEKYLPGLWELLETLKGLRNYKTRLLFAI